MKMKRFRPKMSLVGPLSISRGSFDWSTKLFVVKRSKKVLSKKASSVI
jgi:hypothetical protein